MDNKHFICTTDQGTAITLRELGYTELPKEGSRWVFLNEPNKIVFQGEDLKVHYTDQLTF